MAGTINTERKITSTYEEILSFQSLSLININKLKNIDNSELF